MELENFNLGENQLIYFGVPFSYSTASISPAKFITLQIIYNYVQCQL